MENPNNFKHWQEGFISYKHLSGQPGAEGVYNIQKNYFEEVDKNTTKWVSYN